MHPRRVRGRGRLVLAVCRPAPPHTSDLRTSHLPHNSAGDQRLPRRHQTRRRVRPHRRVAPRPLRLDNRYVVQQGVERIACDKLVDDRERSGTVWVGVRSGYVRFLREDNLKLLTLTPTLRGRPDGR
jgi:hypothetical protein